MPQNRGGDVRWWCWGGFVEGHQLLPWVAPALPVYFGASAPPPHVSPPPPGPARAT